MRNLCEVIRHPRVLTINCALFLLFFSNDSYIMMIALGNRLNLDILSSVKLNESSKNCLCCAIIIFINIAILNIIWTVHSTSQCFACNSYLIFLIIALCTYLRFSVPNSTFTFSENVPVTLENMQDLKLLLAEKGDDCTELQKQISNQVSDIIWVIQSGECGIIWVILVFVIY